MDRDDLEWRVIGNMPAWAQDDPYVFFEEAYLREARGRWAVALVASMPRELTRDQQRELADDFASSHLLGHAYLMVQHTPRASDGGDQPHIHILFSERKDDGIARDKMTYFKRANRQEPLRGGTAKDQFWTQRWVPSRLRESWSDLTNYHLERADHEARVDFRGLSKRGIARESGYNRAPGKARYASQTPDARRERERTAAQEQAMAREHWETRKRELGITDVRQISREDMAKRTRTWVRSYVPGRILPARTPEYWAREAVQMREQYTRGLHAIKAVETEHFKAQIREERGRSATPEEQEHIRRAVQHAAQHGQRQTLTQALGERESGRGGVKVRLAQRREDVTHEQDIGWGR
jgi:hypothetical protein